MVAVSPELGHARSVVDFYAKPQLWMLRIVYAASKVFLTLYIRNYVGNQNVIFHARAIKLAFALFCESRAGNNGQQGLSSKQLNMLFNFRLI